MYKVIQGDVLTIQPPLSVSMSHQTGTVLPPSDREYSPVEPWISLKSSQSSLE